MPDFGDEILSKAARILSELQSKYGSLIWRKGKDLIIEYPKRIRAQNAQQAYQDRVQDAFRNMSQTQSDLKQALATGIGGNINLTDGKAQSQEFDLSIFEGEDQDYALKLVKDQFSKNNLDPDKFLPVLSNDSSNPVPTGRYTYTFEDSEAAQFDKAYSDIMDVFSSDDRLLKAAELDGTHIALDGFGQLTDKQRQQFFNSFTEQLDKKQLDPSLVSLSLNSDQSLAGDLSVPFRNHDNSLKVELEKAVESWNEEYKDFNSVPKLHTSRSTQAASHLKHTYDSVIKEASDLQNSVLANGVDAQIHVTPEGTIQEKYNLSDIATVQKINSQFYEQKNLQRSIANKKSQQKKRAQTDPNHKRSWQEIRNHAKNAAAYDKLAKQAQAEEKLRSGFTQEGKTQVLNVTKGGK